jgi:hypothetical protein
MKFVDALAELIEKHFGGSQEPTVETVVEVTKAVDSEKRMALFVVLEPQDGDETTDLHGDTYTAEEIEKACNNFNTHCRTANIFHQVQTQDVDIVQSFITPAGFTLDNGVEVKKGSWLQWMYFPETEIGEALWQGVKSGEINGVSINAMATTEDLTQ